MTEAEWLTSTDPEAMLHGLLERPEGWRERLGYSDRKLRLFACGCVRAWSPRRVEAALVPQVEAMADRGVSDEDYEALDFLLRGSGATWARWWAANQIGERGGKAALLRCIVGNPWGPVPALWESYVLEDGEGNSMTCRKWYVTPAVAAIARTIYDENRWGELGVLADALEEAGCEGEAACPSCRGVIPAGARELHDHGLLWCVNCEDVGRIPHPLLAHLRGPEPHARGCWAVDLVLGKE